MRIKKVIGFEAKLLNTQLQFGMRDISLEVIGLLTPRVVELIIYDTRDESSSGPVKSSGRARQAIYFALLYWVIIAANVIERLLAKQF